jgi:hypothetical protein
LASRPRPVVRWPATVPAADESANYRAGMGSFIQLLAENIGKVRPPITPVTTKVAA